MKLCVDCQQLITPEYEDCDFDPEQLCKACWFAKHPEVPKTCPVCKQDKRPFRYAFIKHGKIQCVLCFKDPEFAKRAQQGWQPPSVVAAAAAADRPVKKEVAAGDAVPRGMPKKETAAFEDDEGAVTVICPCRNEVTMSDDGKTITCDVCGKVWDMINPVHKVAYDWHHLPETALYQNFPEMTAAIDKLIERQNQRGEYVVDTELTALTQKINDELVVQLGSFRRFMDGIHLLMQEAETKGLYDPANFCIPKKMFRKKGTITWLIKNKLIETFEGSTLQVKSLEFKFSDEDLARTAVEVYKKRAEKRAEKAVDDDDGCFFFFRDRLLSQVQYWYAFTSCSVMGRPFGRRPRDSLVHTSTLSRPSPHTAFTC
mmetsp:Transcript_21701/g.56644  ORF Transcript_21701/g.56644 Transcript_21701/m.56644 type:complete len:371 (+) Transcript_21701:2858-3970(+)